MDTSSTTDPTPTNENMTYSNNKCCDDCRENWYRYIAYFFVVMICCPCICIDKCGGCKKQSELHHNGVGHGISVGMLLRQPL